ncbi:unnamed protein product, partial [Ixodes hexagonus]
DWKRGPASSGASDVSSEPGGSRCSGSGSPCLGPTRNAPDFRNEDDEDDEDGGGGGGNDSSSRRVDEHGDSTEAASDGSASPHDQEPLALDARTSGARSTASSAVPDVGGRRRSPLETLARVFPSRTQASLAAVLDRCQGDVLLAIDEVLQGLRHEETAPGIPLGVLPGVSPSAMSLAGAFRRPLYPPPAAHVSRSPPSGLLGAVPAYPGLFPPPEFFALTPSNHHAKRARFAADGAALWPPGPSESPPGTRDRLKNGD